MIRLFRSVAIILIFLLLVISGWQLADRVIPREKKLFSLEEILHSAGSNRQELEKVLHRYQENPADSLKYKAACFLIKNMAFYSYPVAKWLDDYKTYYIWLKDCPDKAPIEIADSVKNIFGLMGKLETKRDIMEVDSAYLCHNIEWAFKVWKEQPWGKNIPFDMFCEYLLPYRIDDEPLTYWREEYYEKYNSLLDSLKQSDASATLEDPIVAATYLMKKMLEKKSRYTGTTPLLNNHIGPKYVEYLTGSCRELTDFTVYLFRALGIPCAIDFMPLRGDTNSRHFWATCWDKDGEDYMIDFIGIPLLTRTSHWLQDGELVKTYRYTFSLNRGMMKEMMTLEKDIYPFWRLPKFKDVTYLNVNFFQKQLSIPTSRVYDVKSDAKIAYLCACSRQEWVPVDWTKYDPEHLVFSSIKKGPVMRVATYENGQLHFITDPFEVDKRTNQLRFYSRGEEKEDVVLYAKYNIGFENWLRDRMIGGVFEGSDRVDFMEKDTLFIIQQRPDRLVTVVRSWSDKKYRYVRYIGNKGSQCNIAEVTFFTEGDTVPLKGKVIGTAGCCQNDGSHEYTNVFDGKSWTSFDYCGEGQGWAGLDLGKPMAIDKIMYTPRNNDNYIRAGDLFELFYCDTIWKSAGGMYATADSLVYHNIPKNVLLLLRNHTRGVDERIFTYVEGKQLWR